MTVLLAPDDCAIYAPPGDEDEHGWANGPTAPPPLWAGKGNLQLSLGVAAVDAASSGGHGPFDPASIAQGTVYLPSDCGAFNGCVLVARGVVYQLEFVRSMPDPISGGADAVVASVSEVTGWLAAAAAFG